MQLSAFFSRLFRADVSNFRLMAVMLCVMGYAYVYAYNLAVDGVGVWAMWGVNREMWTGCVWTGV